MRIKHELAAHKKYVIKVQFERQSPEADTLTIEVVYGIHFPDGLSITDTSRILERKSVTRTDTREPIQITDEENDMVTAEAVEYAAGLSLSSF
jgi:hypothetical protein